MSNDSNNHSNVQVTDEVGLHVVSVPSGISYNTATDGGWEAKPGILATARNAAGSPTGDFSRGGVTVLLDPSDENTRTNIETAVTLGVLRRDGMGGYREAYTPHAPAQAPQQAQPAPQPHPQQEPKQSQTDEIIDGVSNALGSAWPEAAAQILAGKQPDIAIISRNSGQSEEYVSQALEVVTASMHLKALEASKAVGLSPNDYEAMRAWAAKHPDGKAALQALVFGGDASRVQRMALLYLTSVPPSVETLQQAGYRVWKDSSGQAMVQLPDGNITSIKAAARAGLL